MYIYSVYLSMNADICQIIGHLLNIMLVCILLFYMHNVYWKARNLIEKNSIGLYKRISINSV